MKALFTIANANLRGGTEILAFNLLHELDAAGMDCWLLSVVPYRGEDSRVVSFADDDYRVWEMLQTKPANKLAGSARSDALLRSLIDAKAAELKVEWIINHTYDICAAIPTDGKYKTAQVFNWSIRGYEDSLTVIIRKKGILGRMLSSLSFSRQRARWHKALPEFTRLVVLTDAAHEEIIETCPTVNPEKLVTIPDPLMHNEDCQVLSSLQNKNLVFVGRLSREKGVMRLLRIWERIVKELPDYTLSIYGTGDMKQEMEAFVAEHKLPGVKFMGFCNDLAQIYTHADLLLMTSDSEGFGMVLIEAMYYGVPCITFDCPVSPKEIIADAGIAIPCFDEGKYATGVLNLLLDSRCLKNMQVNAIIRAKHYFAQEVVSKWKDISLLE